MFLRVQTYLLILLMGSLWGYHCHADPDPDDPKGRGNSLCEMLFDDGFKEPSLKDFLSPISGFKHRTDNYRHGGKLACGLKPRNQRAVGDCWSQGKLRQYELRALRNRGKKVKLSSSYLFVQHLFHKTLGMIDRQGDLTEGRSLEDTQNLINEVGLMPHAAWNWRIPLQKSGLVIRRMLFHLRVVANNARISLDQDRSEENKSRIRRQIRETIEAFTGPWPTNFKFGAKTYTPQEFLQSDLFTPPDSTGENPTFASMLASQNDFWEILKTIKFQLDVFHEPLLISLKWEPTFIHSRTGIASMAAFSPFKMNRDTIRQQANLASAKSDEAGYHSVLVVDYALDEDGLIEKLLVLNSWGSRSGDQGFYHIYRDYLQGFLYAASVLSPPR